MIRVVLATSPCQVALPRWWPVTECSVQVAVRRDVTPPQDAIALPVRPRQSRKRILASNQVRALMNNDYLRRAAALSRVCGYSYAYWHMSKRKRSSPHCNKALRRASSVLTVVRFPSLNDVHYCGYCRQSVRIHGDSPASLSGATSLWTQDRSLYYSERANARGLPRCGISRSRINIDAYKRWILARVRARSVSTGRTP